MGSRTHDSDICVRNWALLNISDILLIYSTLKQLNVI
jgi:hypothetical protein